MKELVIEDRGDKISFQSSNVTKEKALRLLYEAIQCLEHCEVVEKYKNEIVVEK